jgi:plasmid stability protein
MAVQNVTIRLSDSLYHQFKQRARRTHRSVEDELAAAVEVALPALDELAPTDVDEMEQMAFLTDQELWQAARSRLTSADSQRMQSLLFQQKRIGLSSDEAAEAEQLVQQQERVMLVRAKATVLLRQRNWDVSELVSQQ